MQHRDFRTNRGARFLRKMLKRLKQRVLPKVAFRASEGRSYLSERLQTFKYIYTEQRKAMENALTSQLYYVTNTCTELSKGPVLTLLHFPNSSHRGLHSKSFYLM